VEAGGVDVERSRYRVLIDQSTEKFDSNEDVKKRLRQVLKKMTRKMKVNLNVSALGSCCSDGE